MSAEQLKHLAVEGRLALLADESVGIYPKSVIGGKRPYRKRNVYQEGWNAARDAVSANRAALHTWYDTIPEGQRGLVDDLLLAGSLSMSVFGDAVMMWVDCSDTFYWGCADGEKIALEELKELTDCYALSPGHGGDLWCCRKREMRPQAAAYSRRYRREEWHLFDACGPARDDPDGRGREPLG